MTNVRFGLEGAPTNPSGEPAPPSLVPTHVGKNTVRIDTIALKNLIDKLKATFRTRR
jgi:hypothetical protein